MKAVHPIIFYNQLSIQSIYHTSTFPNLFHVSPQEKATIQNYIKYHLKKKTCDYILIISKLWQIVKVVSYVISLTSV